MDTKKVTIPKELSDAIKRFLRLSTVCEILKKNDKFAARSWDDIFEKNSNEIDFFVELLHSALCFSNKTLFCYDASKADLEELDQLIFPEISALDVLKKNSDCHILFSKRTGQNIGAFSSFISRNASETHFLKSSDLADGIRSALWTPDSVIKLTRQVKAITFDSLIVDKESALLFVLIDNNRFQFEETPLDMLSAFISMVRERCPSFSKLQLIDLYPTINKIYADKYEGLIHRLAFECNTGVVRDEKLKPGQLDLRKEEYHIAGKSAIGGTVSPFKVGVTWIPAKYSQLQCEAELEVNGTRGNLHAQRGVFSALIRSSGTLRELEFTLHRLSLYV